MRSVGGTSFSYFFASLSASSFPSTRETNKDIKAGIATCRKTLAAIAIRVYAVENALPKKCQANLMVDLVEQVFTTLNLKYPTFFDDKMGVRTAERAKDMARMAAKSLEPAQVEELFRIKNLTEKYSKVLQDMPHV